MNFFKTRMSWVKTMAWAIAIALSLFQASPAHAALTDDHFDGNIFPLYAGNGSLVPPRVSLVETLQQHRPALLVFYIDDSSDCKEYVSTVSQLDSFYGRAANFIPIIVDSIPPASANRSANLTDTKSAGKPYSPSEAGYYYRGKVPQTVLLDANGKIVLDEDGIIPFERVDDVFRQVFDLLPRSESIELKRRPVNEVNTELVN